MISSTDITDLPPVLHDFYAPGSFSHDLHNYDPIYCESFPLEIPSIPAPVLHALVGDVDITAGNAKLIG